MREWESAPRRLGATGHVGAYILHALAHSAAVGAVVCLVRAKDTPPSGLGLEELTQAMREWMDGMTVPRTLLRASAASATRGRSASCCGPSARTAPSSTRRCRACAAR